ncbi:MAG: hypothetical protein E7544_01285 [Ruminococcaceae bacterium]|nr:hypothetical protein [Oscillospiraceae bacterium]
MRSRNNRIAVRITNEDYEKLQEYAKRSFFPKEVLLRYIIAGYPIQEKPTKEAIKFLVAFRSVGSAIGNLCLKYDLKNTPIGEDLEAVKEMMYETDRSLHCTHYVHYDNKLKKQIRKFKKEAIKNGK